MKPWLIASAALAAALAALPVRADDQLPPAKRKRSGAPVRPAGTKPAPPASAANDLSQTTPLTPGPAVVRQNNVNVRGQATIKSEIVTRLKKGDQVTVLEEINKPGSEPPKWAKIALPPTVPVWAHVDFIDPATKTVRPNRLNLRSGPGENYSIIGRLEKGAAVKEIETQGNWTKIEAPANAYGYVAAHLLTSETAPPAIAAAEPPPATTPATEPAPVPAPPPTETPIAPVPTPAPAGEPIAVTPPPATEAPAIPATETPTVTAPPPAEPPVVPGVLPTFEEEPKRIVTREGIVRRSVSIQAPSYFVLESLDTARAVNYLYATNLALRDFEGRRILVSGEEVLDERWPNTPVIEVQRLQLTVEQPVVIKIDPKPPKRPFDR